MNVWLISVSGDKAMSGRRWVDLHHVLAISELAFTLEDENIPRGRYLQWYGRFSLTLAFQEQSFDYIDRGAVYPEVPKDNFDAPVWIPRDPALYDAELEKAAAFKKAYTELFDAWISNL